MASVLKPGGVLGLLTSNRFLFIRSGASLRQLLRVEFDVEAIYDLGDTKLFEAAVLPVIVVARKQTSKSKRHPCSFDRVYECRSSVQDTVSEQEYPSILDVLRDRERKGVVRAQGNVFCVERGTLLAANHDAVWSLSNPEYEDWLQAVGERTHCSFGDVGQVRVGIKTTADRVFVRRRLGEPSVANTAGERPVAAIDHSPRRRALGGGRTLGTTCVLYPHEMREGKRHTIDLAAFPRARSYLESHRDRLCRRKYLLDAGRQWYEIWVPHNPSDWAKPRIVFPDIAEEPRFFLDTSEAIVNGDCYWITLKQGSDSEWLMLMAAVANSTFITRYYDIVFHNKLYAGRRRFMAQYVSQFPLPDLHAPISREIVKRVSAIVDNRGANEQTERELNDLMFESSAYSKKSGGSGICSFLFVTLPSNRRKNVKNSTPVVNTK